MEISNFNPQIYEKMGNYSKTNFSGNEKIQTMGVEDKLPNPELYSDCDNFYILYTKRKELSDEYCKKIMQICFDKDGKIDSRIKKYLDTAKFNIKASDAGETKQMTIKEAINSAIIRRYRAKGNFYHATAYKEIGDKIIEEGFDPMKISRTKFGPGFYFSPSEGGALMYSNCVLKSDFDGECALVDGPFYDRITDSDASKKLREFIGLKSNSYSIHMAEYEILSKIINEYSRDYLVNELGIDMAYGSSRAESCFAVFNPQILSNIRFN